MRFTSYWQDTAPAFTGAAAGPIEGHYDAVVIGGGFTGLAAARQLAKNGARVALLEGERIGAGASGRNGGHLNNGLAHSYLAARASLGPERAKALYAAFDAGVDTVEALVTEERIPCDFRRSGKLKLASKPAHAVSLRRNFEAICRDVDPDTAFLERSDLANEIAGPGFFGGLLSRKSASMHMGRFVVGLAEAAVRHGADVFEGATVSGLHRQGTRHEVRTSRGTLTAEAVLLATGAYTGKPFDYFRRRIVPVGSFIVATRPLSEVEIARLVPGRRNYVTSLNIGNYFRLTADGRLIFGGRARFSATSDQRSDARSGEILRASLGKLFPALAGVEIDYCWGGLVDMTKDRLPRAGEVDGVHYAMGYSGHGTQMSTHMGVVMADVMLGRATVNPLAFLAWPTIPGHTGKPWFLPMVGAYFKMLDLVR